MNGEHNQIVPCHGCAPLSAKLLKSGILKNYKSISHGMPTTEADTINADLLEFIRGLRQGALASVIGPRRSRR